MADTTFRALGVYQHFTVTTQAELLETLLEVRAGALVELTATVTPFDFEPPTVYPEPGVIVKFPDDQIWRGKFIDLSEANLAVVGGRVSGDTVAGNTNGDVALNSGLYFESSSKIGIYSVFIDQSYYSIAMQDCTDLDFQYNLFHHARGDNIASTGSLLAHQIRISNNLFREGRISGMTILWYNNGTVPEDNAGDTADDVTSFFEDTHHGDVIQLNGVGTTHYDWTVTDNDISVIAQGIFGSPSEVSRFHLARNLIKVTIPHAVLLTGGDMTIDSNAVSYLAAPSGFGVNSFTVNRSGVGKIQGRNNTNAAGSITSPSGVDLASATMNGDSGVTLPTSPDLNFHPWLTDLMEVPSYTARSTPPDVAVPPELYYRSGSPSTQPAVGEYVSVGRGMIAGFEGLTGQEWRWTRNGTPISGQTARVYQVVSGDIATSLRCETRVENSFGWGSWVASAALVPTA